LIFKQGIKSYRDLPLRYGEFGQCHRNEPTGGLHGIMRVRGFTQDDGHIFCTEDQILAESVNFTTLLQKVYRDFGFTDILYRLSTRPEKRIGSDESWDRAEAALAEGLRASGCDFEYLPGEGAFYGPKIEYTLKDAIGREWQCGTIQVDPNMPERLDAEYVGEDGARHRPIMLHRAIVGSLERFIGILVEQHAGALPTWLAPVQVAVLNITSLWKQEARGARRGAREPNGFSQNWARLMAIPKMRRFLCGDQPDDYSYRRPERKAFHHLGLIAPSIERRGAGHIA
jgi:threonyl-tRNA synthetase